MNCSRADAAEVKRIISTNAPTEIILVAPRRVDAASITTWKKENFQAVAVVLDEGTDAAVYRDAARQISSASLDLYYWIEVARNPRMAEAHPRWMASLGMHDDWQKRFPNAPRPKQGQVAKAFPWVPIWYQEAFDAHLVRVEALLKKVPDGWRGVLLNDLQGGPSSCGCGNLQCRWATDYHVVATGTRIAGDDVPAKFVAAVQQKLPGKAVVPVWVTECEEQDLPANKRADGKTTGLCGSVGCAVGLCPKDFTKQWSALLAGHEGPIGLLALTGEFDRERAEYGTGAGWVRNAAAYLDQTPPQNGAGTFPRERLWLVVQGYDTQHETAARRLARETGARAVVIARTRIDQSYEPHLVAVKE
jgi:hypothetical protein